MKPETLIYEKIKKVIPDNSDKTVFFAAISKTSYEVYFYSYIDGNPIQCYELVEQDKLDGNELDESFEAVVDIYKESKHFNPDKYNIATIKVDKSGIKMDVEYFEKDVRMYKLKKDWKENNIN